MNTETNGLVERYVQWLREKSSERELDGGWKALTLPFLDHHNDHLEVYVRQESDGLRITDDGRIARDLKQIGCDLKVRTKRRAIAEKILKGLGFTPDLLDKGELTKTAVNGDFPQELHSILSSMLALDGLANTAQSSVVVPFKEEVANWFKSAGVHAEADARFVGHSGVSHEFDFQIPQTKIKRAKVVHSIAVPDRVHIQSFTYSVIDIRDELNGNSPEFYAFINDNVLKGKKQYLALLSHDIEPMWWSRRDEYLGKLVG